MSNQSACPRCHRVGFVHVETVVKAGEVYHTFDCAACGNSWQMAKDDRRKSPRTPPPDKP